MRLISVLVASLLLLSEHALAQSVTIGTAAQYDSGEFTVDPTVLQGFDKALGDILCQRAELTCEWKAMAQNDLLPALTAKEIDVVMAALPTTADLGDGIESTAPYLYPDPFVFVGLPGVVPFGNIKTVATTSDPAIDVWHAKTGYNRRTFPTMEEALEAVENGVAEFALGERETIAPLVTASGGRLEIVPDPRRLRPGVTMALHSDNIDLRFTFEDHIYDMSQDGSLNALTEEWFGIDATKW